MLTFPALPVFVPVNPALLDTQLLIAMSCHCSALACLWQFCPGNFSTHACRRGEWFTVTGAAAQSQHAQEQPCSPAGPLLRTSTEALT